MNQLKDLLHEIKAKGNFISGILSAPRSKQGPKKTDFSPVTVRSKEKIQVSDQVAEKVIHKNIERDDLPVVILEKALLYKQGIIFTEDADYYLFMSKDNEVRIVMKGATKKKRDQTHNRPKKYIMEENQPNRFLEALGVMNREGKVYPKKYDKFRQLNRFLEFIRDIVPNLPKDKPIRIIDFGCGKSYLTFAVYYYLKELMQLDVNILGLDLKKEVIEDCESLARNLQYQGLHFQVGDIKEYQMKGGVDLVVSLHACDTATDAALGKAIEWKAKVILCVPCCQHELFQQVENQDLKPILKYGLLKERFAAIATDAARAQLLEIAGYRTQVLEFIDMEHTPKNVLIRAVLEEKENSREVEKKWEEYGAYRDLLNIRPYLEKFVRNK